MDMMKIIKTRKSVRTFDGTEIPESELNKLCSYIETIENPYDVPVEFILLDAKKT
ncbi:nitroreductase family protein [uncultured Methanobrevibacter sp.]|uniref:nitroreductase family protein n=1 Tax=uncultured Methanobrevibacter sp. TaxID=253161 RepID=UPI0025E1C259|nr:nitroreductase family protein [uncultured Methanobrevibacter sp.]